MIAVSKATGRALEDVASAFFLTGERLHLDWLEGRLAELPDTSRWQRWAAQAMVDDAMALRRDVALRVLQNADSGPVDGALDAYLGGRREASDRLDRLVNVLTTQGETGLAALTVALRQVRGLAS